jgi:TolB-like protein/DNA-binding winged helix-turn-helix (wHTH) protein
MTGATAQEVTGYQVDDLLIDLGQQRVIRAGTEIPLPGLSYDLLVTLTQAAPNFVSFDQLIERVWPGLVVAPETISQRVKLVRDALNDDPQAPRYIGGLRGRGYRMVATVRPLMDTLRNSTTDPAARAKSGPASAQSPSARRLAYLGGAAVLAATLIYIIISQFRSSIHVPVSESETSAAHDSVSRVRSDRETIVPFTPPQHSIAVLPFANMSGDKDQDNFSDGLSEELLNMLSRIDGLQVAARTSSFSFRKENTDIAAIARKLNVAAVLEGSVRRSAHTVRVSAELVDAVTGYRLWSQSYDRSLGDVLALQTEIATAVTHALQIPLLGGVAATIQLGATRDPAAFDAYLRGLILARKSPANAENALASIAAYSDAIRLDPSYALALVGRAYTLGTYAGNFASVPAARQSWDRARADAEKAIALAPNLGEGHMVLGAVHLYASQDFVRAGKELDRALALAPGNAIVLYEYARFAAFLGHSDTAIATARRGAMLDPLNLRTHRELGDVLLYARRYGEALSAYQESITLDPERAAAEYGRRGTVYYLLDNLQMALLSCETRPEQLDSQVCLAIVFHKLGQKANADSALARLVAANGDAAAYQYAEIQTQWGNAAAALNWLEVAMRLHDSGLPTMKVDPLLDPLRELPRYQGIERALMFPT